MMDNGLMRLAHFSPRLLGELMPRGVVYGVFAAGHYLQVFRSVIVLVAVDVVDIFRGKKFTPKNLLHNNPVRLQVNAVYSLRKIGCPVLASWSNRAGITPLASKVTLFTPTTKTSFSLGIWIKSIIVKLSLANRTAFHVNSLKGHGPTVVLHLSRVRHCIRRAVMNKVNEMAHTLDRMDYITCPKSSQAR